MQNPKSKINITDFGFLAQELEIGLRRMFYLLVVHRVCWKSVSFSEDRNFNVCLQKLAPIFQPNVEVGGCLPFMPKATQFLRGTRTTKIG